MAQKPPHNNQTDISQLVSKIHSCSVIETEKMFSLYQDYIQQKLSASTITWIAAYRGDYGREHWKTELLNNWKVMEVTLRIDGTPECIAAMQADYYQMAKKHGIDPLSELAIKAAGKTRVYRRAHVIPESEWAEHWLKKEYWDKYDIGDRMSGVFNIDSQAESYIIIDRPIGAEPFNQDDEQVLYQALQEFPRLHYLLLLERGLTKHAQRPLAPRQQELVKLMLGPLSEKDIASKMGLSQVTVHSYIKDLYKNFNIKNRLEMIQLWLNPLSGNQ